MASPFSFGAPSSSGQPNNNATTSNAPSSGGLFGSSTTPTPSSGGLFGGQSKPTTFAFGNVGSGGNSGTTASSGTSSGSMFGNVGPKPGEQKPLFGATSSAAPGSSTPSLTGGAGGIFGASSQTPSSTSMFGSTPAAASTGTSTGLFGNSSSTPNAITTSTTPTTTAPAGGLFAQANTAANQGTSANKPGGMFGAGSATTGNSLFGGTSSNTTSANQVTPAKPMFLNSTTPAGAPPSNTSKPSGGGGFFGNTATQSGSSLFPSALQGEKRESQPTSLFASQPNSQSKLATTQPTASPFPGTSQPQKAGTSLFGATKPAEPSSTLGTKPTAVENTGTMSSTNSLSLFGQPAPSKPAETASSTKPASLFGNATTSTAAGGSPFLSSTNATQTPNTSTPAPSATQTNSLFGNANKPTTGTTIAEPPKPQLFGKPPSSATSEAPKPSNLLGATSLSTATPSTTTTPATNTTAPATTTAPSVGSLLGNVAKATPSVESTVPKPATSQTASLGASTSGPTSAMARLKNRTMDEILNRWATDLSKYQKEYKEQASQVAAWDRLLVENGDKIQKLYLNTFEAEKASREVERHLVAVESQQEELESWLDKYESEVDTLFSKQVGPGEQLAGPDQERERTYKLAEKITERLDEMGRDLTTMIKEINDISGTVSKGSKPDDPLSQIVRVLNGHLTQLQWIDTNAAALQAKVVAAQKTSSQIGNQYGGPEQDNVDSFYRSYMGRR
ncbi:hypothetical protein E0Z10_g746 [Xylaria hypoxylon]|uniref:Nucleoporin NSP1 n=1 Tax=Xylaria hypoxylon TaxID=37992 RepID=A0A4Z0YVN8_9PEZI|nr:hypothetical protein E0Z10_g746 [Xylaria hypoxylon]